MKRILALALTLAMVLSVCLFAGCGDTPDETTTASSTPAETTGKTETTTADSTPAESTPADTTTSDTVKADGTTTAGGTEPEDTTAITDTEPIGGTELEGFNGYTKLPGFEDIDFGGRVFTFAMMTDDGSNGGNSKDIYSDETDAIATSIRERNNVVEKLYNCSIAYNFSESPGTLVASEVSGNMHTIDIYAQQYSSSAIYTADQAYNLYSLGIDFENPWWDQAYVSTYTFDKNGMPAM